MSQTERDNRAVALPLLVAEGAGLIEDFAALADRIRDKRAAVTPRFVAIDGPSGAGTSTFALRLARSLGEPPVIPPGPLVILEGVTSSRREAANLLTYAVWIDAPSEVRLGPSPRAGRSDR